MTDDLRQKSAYQPNAIVASAELLTEERIQRGLPKTADWADEAWLYFDTIPEVRFGVGWVSNALSRCRIGAARRGRGGDEPHMVDPPDEGPIPGEDPEAQPPDPVPRADQVAFDLVSEFAGGTAGQSQVLANCAVQLTVPGVGWIVGEPGGNLDDGTPGPETWQVLSNDELKAVSGRLVVKTGDNAVRKLAPDALAVRFWRSHERYHYKPDSPLRACLPTLRELALLTAHIDATAVSRLAGAGLLIMPSEIQFPVSEKNKDKPDPFLAELVDAMMTPIKDRDSAAAVVPLPIRVKGEFIEKIQHLTFSTPLDEKAMALREEAVRRFAAGMDMPAEIVTGMGKSNHWTAWQIEESALKLHIEPMLEAVCHALTVGYLQPALAAVGIDEPDLIIWYDTSELSVRPDRSGDAKDVYDKGGIGLAALRRETGFAEDDAPDDAEIERQLLIALINAAPAMAPALLPLLGIEIDPSLLPPTGGPAGGGEAPPTPDNQPSPNGPPDTGGEPPPPPAPDSSSEAALLAAADAIVTRALEIAGRRFANAAQKAGIAMSCDSPVMAHTCVSEDLRIQLVDSVFDGVWERVPEIAERYNVEPHALTATLQDYSRSLVLAGWMHTYDKLAGVLGG